ncbi:MAG: 4-hydroxybenzoate octaprenyltransferase, partial [Burkholderiales bacterium]|nr:4-hydroxybenzoate octaprenyltransferase [Burkholderiales bacterium]
MIKHYLELIRVDKPIGTLLLLWPTLWGLFFAQNGVPSFRYLLIFASGVFLTRASGCAFNDIADSQFDKHVKRTKNRPLVRNVISTKQAVCFATLLSILAFTMAIITLSTKTILLCIPALLIYLTYPLFKRFFPIPQAYLGIAFSFGILMAFMQITGHIGTIAWLTFIANLFWVIAYDTIYALVDIEDDLKIGIKTAAITFGKSVNQIIALCFAMFIILMIVIGIKLHLNFCYFIGIIFASGLIIRQLIVLYKKTHPLYFKIFLSNNQVGIIIFIGALFA